MGKLEKPVRSLYVLENLPQVGRLADDLTGNLLRKVVPRILRNFFNNCRRLSKEEKMSQRFPLWQVVTGRRFNELSKGRRFYKLTNANEFHHGFLYRDGLNVDTEHFIALPNHSGLHFTEDEMIPVWVEIFKSLGTHLKWKRRVIIADDAKIYCMYNQLKTDQIILGPREEL